MLAMRQILLGPRGAAPVPLPYDYEAEYIQRDYAIPWIEDGASVVGGVDLGQYIPTGAAIPTFDFTIDARVSGGLVQSSNTNRVHPLFSFVYHYSIFGYNATGRVGFGVGTTGINKYVFFALGSTRTAIDTPLPSEDNVVDCRITASSGTFNYYADDTLVQTKSRSVADLYEQMALLSAVPGEPDTATSLGRMYSFKMSNTIDLIPVVKGEQCGFYNKVDGALFLANQACLTAGPAVSANRNGGGHRCLEYWQSWRHSASRRSAWKEAA